MIISIAKNMFFLIFLIMFSISDFRYKKITLKSFLIYFIIGVVILILSIQNQVKVEIYEIIKSILFGLIIIFVSIISKSAIGRGDGIYFMLNAFYVNFVTNITMFITGIYIMFLFSIYIYIKNRGRVKNLTLPFIPFLLPYGIWSFYAQCRI